MPRSYDPYILLPVKKLAASKTRLSKLLNAQERSFLTLRMLEDVMGSLGNYVNVFVVTSDLKLSDLAKAHGFRVIESGLCDLNGDLTYARSQCMTYGATSILYLLPDLPVLMPEDIEGIIKLGVGTSSAVIAPSKDGGTNALFLRPCDLIDPGFGYLSLEKHLFKIRETGVEPVIYSSVGTELDIDTPDDIRDLLSLTKSFDESHRALSYLREHITSRLNLLI